MVAAARTDDAWWAGSLSPLWASRLPIPSVALRVLGLPRALRAWNAGLQPSSLWLVGLFRIWSAYSPDRVAAFCSLAAIFGYTHPELRRVLISLARRGAGRLRLEQSLPASHASTFERAARKCAGHDYVTAACAYQLGGVEGLRAATRAHVLAAQRRWRVDTLRASYWHTARLEARSCPGIAPAAHALAAAALASWQPAPAGEFHADIDIRRLIFQVVATLDPSRRQEWCRIAAVEDSLAKYAAKLALEPGIPAQLMTAYNLGGLDLALHEARQLLLLREGTQCRTACPPPTSAATTTATARTAGVRSSAG